MTSHPPCALVTGGGGFLGQAVIRRLLSKNYRVRSLCRRDYPELAALGVTQIQGDIRNEKTVISACSGADVVFHTAAKAGVWGKTSDYYEINVLGTAHVVSALTRQGTGFLIHTSSPSVVFDGSDMAGVNESAPYPSSYIASYPATKAASERLVVKAANEGLPAIILRPHLIWGPGDNHLVPRIVSRASKLRCIGDGRNLVDTVYIDNAADAHLLAFERLKEEPSLSGKIYFITQGEPVALWGMVDDILKAAGKQPVRGRISKKTAWMLGMLLEGLYRIFRLPGEPQMTRFLAEELSTSHFFDIRAAREELHYTPSVTTREGLSRLSHWFRNQSAGQRPRA